MRAALIFLSLLVLAPAAQAADPSITDGSAQAKLNAAEDLWLASHLTDYRFRLRVGCFCSTDVTDPHVIRVRNSKAVNANRYNRPFSTVPKLFREIQRAIHHPAAVLTVRYGATGAPRKLYIDSDENLADEELSLQVSHLRALPKAGAAAAPSIEDGSAQTALDAARAKWAAYDKDDYKFTLKQHCFCPTQITDPTTIIVKDGKALNTTRYNRGYATVERLFATAQGAISRKADGFSASYDPVTGVPRSIGIDPMMYTFDDETGLSVTHFKAGDFTKNVAPSILDGSAARALAAAEQHWARRGLFDYDFHLTVSCFCPVTDATIRVRDGEATGPRTARPYNTVPKLFNVVHRAIDALDYRLKVSYSKRGVPRSIFLEQDPARTDDTLQISATRLRKP